MRSMHLSSRTRTFLAASSVVVGSSVLTALPSFSAGAVAGVKAASDVFSSTACAAMEYPIYHRINPTTHASLLTPWRSEFLNAANHGFTYAQISPFMAAINPDVGLSPVTRLYKATTSDFVWSADADEIATLHQSGYVSQRVDFYAATAASPCVTAVHSLTSGGMHRYAVGDEVDTWVKAGWKDSGAAFYAPSSRPGTTQPSDPTTPTTPDTPDSPDTPETPGTPPADPDADGSFSLAVLPDVQEEVTSASDRRLDSRNAYLVANRATKDIRYTIQVGDIVNWDTASDENPNDHRQFDIASRGMKVLEDAGMKWAGAIGNHDTYAVGPTGGAARAGIDTSLALRNTTTYNSYFGVKRFSDVAGTFEPGKIDNSYRVFNALGKKWMVLSLELWPRKTAVQWAKSVVAAHPQHNVIVVTHAYLSSTGTILQDWGGYGSTTPQYLYDDLIKKYANIKFVLSGHIGGASSRVDTGEKGNKIISLMQTYHSTTNPTRFVKISDNGAVSTTVYANHTNENFPNAARSWTGMTWVK